MEFRRGEHLEKFVTLQAYYSLVGRELERELMPMMLDQKIGLLVWSPLAGGFLTGKFTRDGCGGQCTPAARSSRFPPVDLEKGYDIVDTLSAVARAATRRWRRWRWRGCCINLPCTSVIIGARNAIQLKDNLGAVDVKLERRPERNRRSQQVDAGISGLDVSCRDRIAGRGKCATGRDSRPRPSDLARNQAGDYFVEHCVGFGLDLRFGLVLNRMRHVNGVEVRPSQRGGLRARRRS